MQHFVNQYASTVSIKKLSASKKDRGADVAKTNEVLWTMMSVGNFIEAISGNES